LTIVIENERAFDPLPRLLIGDSICRMETRPGARICHVAYYAHKNKHLLQNRELIQIVVGTNDLGALCNECIIDCYRALVRLLMEICPGAKVQICSQLPRLVDTRTTKQRQLDIARDVKKMCKQEGADYAKIHTAFIRNRLPVPFRFKADQLHPNIAGQAHLEVSLIRAGSKALGYNINRDLGRGMIREERKDSEGEGWMIRAVGHELC